MVYQIIVGDGGKTEAIGIVGDRRAVLSILR